VTEEGRSLSRRHVIAAGFACGALAAAVVGRLTACAGCEHEIFGVPLFAAGSVYYLALGLLALFGVNPVIIGWVSLPGVAIQAGLIRYLFVLGAPCWTCIVAAASLFTLSLVCLMPDRRWRFAPAIVALAGAAVLPLWSGLLVETERITGLPEFAREADLRPVQEGSALMVVYDRPGCPYCKAFERDYAPRLIRDFGTGLFVRRVDATGRKGLVRLPCFLIRSRDGSLLLVRGLPPYADLAAMVGPPAPGK
jgi:uncharacterized membrane protein